MRRTTQNIKKEKNTVRLDKNKKLAPAPAVVTIVPGMNDRPVLETKHITERQLVVAGPRTGNSKPVHKIKGLEKQSFPNTDTTVSTNFPVKPEPKCIDRMLAIAGASMERSVTIKPETKPGNNPAMRELVMKMLAQKPKDYQSTLKHRDEFMSEYDSAIVKKARVISRDFGGGSDLSTQDSVFVRASMRKVTRFFREPQRLVEAGKELSDHVLRINIVNVHPGAVAAVSETCASSGYMTTIEQNELLISISQ